MMLKINIFRCDGKTDCLDASDEIKCTVVELSSSYNKFISPPVPQNSSSDKLGILSSISINSLSSFDPINANYEVKFTIELKWLDGRLKYNNLWPFPDINSLQPQEMEKIWFPYFIFDNTKKKNLSLLDGKASIKVLKIGSGILSGSDDTENKYIFDGFENLLEYRRFYSLEFECEYGFHWYPFDTQICFIDVTSTGDLKDFIQFEVDNFSYLGPLDLTEYSVKKTDMRVENGTLLRVEVIIQRRLLSLVLTAFVPTIILNIIGHMSNYFKEFFFEGLMSLNVTVMLVLTTMFLRFVNFVNFFVFSS